MDLASKVDLLRRPSPSMQRALPFGVRSVSVARFAPGNCEDTHVRAFAKIMWCVSGTALVTFNGIERTLAAEQIAVYLPDTLHKARAGREPWHVCWWTMDGPLVARTMAAFGLESEGVYDAGAAPVHKFRELSSAIRDITPDGEARASAIAFELMAMASRRPRPPQKDAVVSEAVSILDREWSSPQLGVEALAERVGTHRSSLSRRFKSALGISPVRYLAGLRMQRALSLLKQTGAPVNDIARRCGYEDASYFTRLFRRMQGVTPSQWRRG